MDISLIKKYSYILGLSRDIIEEQYDKNTSLHYPKTRTTLPRSTTTLSIINIARIDTMKLEPKNEFQNII